MKRYKRESQYRKRYPHYLPWSKAMWIVKPGDRIKDCKSKKVYIVERVELPPIEGAIPKVSVKEDGL